ncbi:hypothetical protein ABDK56_11545 [Sphingomonas sp. ASV193]|uniref:hypothetical protein n=1 Tax=Sphingomonas sp. ASV193 TaxID=3144405 RepID=UPI0032E8BA71
MTSRFLSGLAIAALVTVCLPQAAAHDAMTADPVASAESAAPASIARAAGIMAMGADGKPTMLRASNNGWTCMPDNPATPGPDPMCMDANAMKWAEAWMGHKPPPADNVGLIYMLAGGTDASNTDPYAAKPTAGADWVRTGPHLMVVGAPSLNAAYRGDPSPDTKVPYVMWAGTPYAHLMVPAG